MNRLLEYWQSIMITIVVIAILTGVGFLIAHDIEWRNGCAAACQTVPHSRVDLDGVRHCVCWDDGAWKPKVMD